jgi:hypothetical protein
MCVTDIYVVFTRFFIATKIFSWQIGGYYKSVGVTVTDFYLHGLRNIFNEK